MPLSPVSDGRTEGDGPESCNPWEDPGSFHTKGREETAVTISVRLPNATARAIAKLVQSGKFPGLDTNSDAIRDATWRWVRWMAEVSQDEDMAHQLDVQRSHWRLEAELQRREQLSSTIDTAEVILNDVGTGDKTRRKVLTELSDLALKVEDCELRRRMLEIIAAHR